MKKAKIQNPKSKIFLGVDGGQSHTEAVVADEFGNILGRGFGGASNHAEQPGGRERLEKAILESVGEALQKADLASISEMRFASVHCAMSGGADYKEEIIGAILQAEKLKIAHDAPAALFGATAGKCGIVVISGTGSVAYGENEKGETAQVGGWGHLFGDEGSGFWLAMLAIKSAIYENDKGYHDSGMKARVLGFFKCQTLREFTLKVYAEEISRDEIAKFAEIVHKIAEEGEQTMKHFLQTGASFLCFSAESVARKIEFAEQPILVAGVGGMFRGNLMKTYFIEELKKFFPQATFIQPRFSPAVGALLLAYREFGIEIDAKLLKNIEKSNLR